MRVLVTGPNGFVGRPLCRALLASGRTVRAAVWRRDPAPCACTERAAVDDIGPATDWSDALRGVDAVVHLAARVHDMGPQSEASRAAFRRVNTEGTAQLARRAAAAGVRRMVFVSTAKIHGERSAERPFREEDPVQARDAYARSKWAAERALREIADRGAMEAVILRPPLVYGPGVKANFLKLVRCVARGLPLPLAAVDNARSLIGLSNLVDALTVCLDAPEAAGRAFLVSDGADVSTPELVRRIAAALDRPARLFPCPAALLSGLARCAGRRAQAARLCGSFQLDIGCARRILHWSPPVDMREELAGVARWFRRLSA